MKRNIISIQSQVASGYVGNNIAALAIQLHGLDPVQVPTVLLSNHIEQAKVYGKAIASELITDLLKGIKSNHSLEQSHYLISGFCYDKESIAAIADFITDTKHDTGYQYVYDPAFGDFRAGGLYLSEEIAQYALSELLPRSDIITPNQFELEYILGRKVNTEWDFLESLKEKTGLSLKTVITTSIEFQDTPKNMIEVALFREGHLERFRVPRVPIEAIGTGDLFTAIVTAQLTLSIPIAQAINRAMDYLHQVLTYTYDQGYADVNAEAMLRYANLLL